jgi:PAS domain S-box-containing protein
MIRPAGHTPPIGAAPDPVRPLFSIGTKLAGLIGLLIAAISIFIYSWFPARMEEAAIRSIMAKVNGIGEMTALTITAPLYFEDIRGIEEVFRNAARIEEVVFLAAFDAKGEIVAAHNPEEIERTHRGRTAAPGRRLRDYPDLVYSQTTPIKLNEETIGHLLIGLSLEPIRAEVERSRSIIALLSLAVFLAGMAGAFGIHLVVTRPLTRMVAVVKKIAAGDLTQRTAVTSRDEVGHLAASFNRMVEVLESSQEDLLRSNRRMKREVEARKRALRELAESEERYRDILESAGDLIVSIQPDGRILYANPAWKRTLGYGDDEIPEVSFFDTLAPESRETLRGVVERMKGGSRPGRFELSFQTRAGEMVDVEGSISFPMEGGAPVKLLGIFHDITERKRVDRMKDDFITTVNHELRTPLTSIHGSLQILHNGHLGELPEAAERVVEIAARNCERLVSLVNNVLDFHKLETGKMTFHLEPVDLAATIREAVEENQGYAERYDVGFSLDLAIPDVRVRADRDRLKQVLTNLLSNAAKFSPPGGTVRVVARRRNGGVRVAVEDHGPGIPESFQDRIFQKFSQADNSLTREKGGTGLGLSIARSIVEQMGGEIGFETRREDESGTTFYFDLPAFDGE